MGKSVCTTLLVEFDSEKPHTEKSRDGLDHSPRFKTFKFTRLAEQPRTSLSKVPTKMAVFLRRFPQTGPN